MTALILSAYSDEELTELKETYREIAQRRAPSMGISTRQAWERVEEIGYELDRRIRQRIREKGR